MMSGQRSLAVFVFVLFVALAVTVVLGALYGTRLRDKVDGLYNSKVFAARSLKIVLTPDRTKTDADKLKPDDKGYVTLFTVPALGCKVPSGYKSYFEIVQASSDAALSITFAAAGGTVGESTFAGKKVDDIALPSTPSTTSPFSSTFPVPNYSVLLESDDVVGPFAFKVKATKFQSDNADITNSSKGSILVRHCIKASC